MSQFTLLCLSELLDLSILLPLFNPVQFTLRPLQSFYSTHPHSLQILIAGGDNLPPKTNCYCSFSLEVRLMSSVLWASRRSDISASPWRQLPPPITSGPRSFGKLCNTLPVSSDSPTQSQRDALSDHRAAASRRFSPTEAECAEERCLVSLQAFPCLRK